MKKSFKVIFSLFFSLGLFLLIPISGFATAPVHRPDITKDAEIVSVRGNSHLRFFREDDWITAVSEQDLTSGDFLKTGSYGRLDILFIDGTQIKVYNRTTLMIKAVRKPSVKNTVLGLEAGEIWSRAKSVPEGLKIETPSVTVAIRGTDWDLVVDEKGTSYLTVLNGIVDMYNDFGRLSVEAGEQAMADVGKPPVKMFLVRPKDRVQWIMSYPLEFARIIPFYSHKRDKVLKLLPSVKEKTQKDPLDNKSRLLLAGLLFDVRETDESLRLFNEILRSDPENGSALTFKGLILLSQGEKENAASYFESAINNLQGEEKAKALLGMAGVYIYKNEIEKAEKILEDLQRIDVSPVVGVALASFKGFLGEFTKAVEIAHEYSSRFPDDERFPALAADLYLTLDEGVKARASLDKALEINPSSSKAYFILGRYYYLEGVGKEAEYAYRKSIELDPANADAISELGKLLMENGDYKESMKKLSESIEINPREHTYWSKRGMLLNWLEEIHQAEEDFKTAVDLNPSDYQSLDGLGYLALKQGRFQEAIQYFLKASLLEPKFAEPHIFLAIAYYQLEDFERALDELRLAGSLDPKDPLPHMIAHLIYQDTYRPFKAIEEASKALELLPNLKSVNPIEETQKGLSNLGSALLGLGMTEWATSYAEESFNPNEASSYFFRSNKFDNNPFIFVSNLTQGFLLNPISIRFSDRYQDIVPYPQYNLTVNTTIGDEDGSFYRKHKITQQGYFRMPWEFTYLLDFENYESEGFRDSGHSWGNLFSFGLGGRPNYKNGFFIWGGVKDSKYGDPGPASAGYDPNDNLKDFIFTLSTGYKYRFGHNNNLLVNFSYNWLKQKFKNPDAIGTAGLSNAELSFINSFGLDNAIMLFEKGIYDVGMIDGIHFYVTDSTGTLSLLGGETLPFNLNSSLDPNPLHSYTVKHKDLGFQIRHLVDIGENHQFTYGFEYIPKMKFDLTEVSSVSQTGDILGFQDELLLGGPLYGMLGMEPGETTSKFEQESDVKIIYVQDRWLPIDNLLIEMGLFYETFNESNTINFSSTDHKRIHPRAGFSLKLADKHILRAAFQKRLYSGTTLSLAPLSTAGLIFEWIQLNPGALFTDYQIGLESRWTEKFFSAVNVERRDFRRAENDEENESYFLTAAVNSILCNELGAFVRYKYADSENQNGLNKGKSLPFLPHHALGGGIVWVSPLHIKASLSTNYFSEQFGDPENTYEISDYWVTNFSATWEPFRKHWMFKLDVQNIFDSNYEIKQDYPEAGRSVFLTAEYRF